MELPAVGSVHPSVRGCALVLLSLAISSCSPAGSGARTKLARPDASRTGQHGGPTAPPASDARATKASPFRAPIQLPGCNPENLAELQRVVTAIDQALHGVAPNQPVPDVGAGIGAAWHHPCLGHLARVFPAPAPPPEGWQALWFVGLGGTLQAMAGSLYVRDGHRYFVAPPFHSGPVVAAQLTERERRELAPWSCPPSVTACGHAGAAIARAEASFDREELLAQRWHGRLVGTDGDPMPNVFLSSEDGCVPSDDDARSSLTRFEAFSVCVASTAPRTWRYPTTLRLRARDRGWLVLRGRRGHYEFDDEIAAYDLATGTAYVARSHSALVLDGPSVNHAAVDAKRKTEVITGTVSAEQARELAFILGTKALIRPARSEVRLIPVPDDLPITFSPNRRWDAPLDVPADTWGSSAHTSLAWALIEDVDVIAEGTLIWPTSWNAAEDHADRLLSVLEGGLEPGCAPARLPNGVVRGRQGRVSPIDADPTSQANTFNALANALEALDRRVCPPRR